MQRGQSSQMGGQEAHSEHVVGPEPAAGKVSEGTRQCP